MKTARLYVDFAPGARRVSWPGRALLMASALFLGVCAWQAADLWLQRDRAIATLADLESQRGARDVVRPVSVKADPKLVATSRAAKQVAAKLLTPWAPLLSSLGSAPTASVALLSIEPSVAKRSVRLTAEARDPREMLAYVQALQGDARLTSVVLVSHQVQVQAAGTPIRFQVQAEWGDPK